MEACLWPVAGFKPILHWPGPRVSRTDRVLACRNWGLGGSCAQRSHQQPMVATASRVVSLGCSPGAGGITKQTGRKSPWSAPVGTLTSQQVDGHCRGSAVEAGRGSGLGTVEQPVKAALHLTSQKHRMAGKHGAWRGAWHKVGAQLACVSVSWCRLNTVPQTACPLTTGVSSLTVPGPKSEVRVWVGPRPC